MVYKESLSNPIWFEMINGLKYDLRFMDNIVRYNLMPKIMDLDLQVKYKIIHQIVKEEISKAQ